MTEYFLSIATAAWLGFLCSISPCPLATNIAAISFVSRRIGKIGTVLAAGFLYMLGRIITYTILGSVLIKGLTAAPAMSHILQKYMNMLMGPLLIIVAMILLDLLKFNNASGFSIGDAIQNKVERAGIFGSFILGVFFALSFCPSAAALFFGGLLPLAIQQQSGLILPSVFGIATGLPVLLFAFLLAFSVNKVGNSYNKLAKFEIWAQRVTGAIFLIVGIGMTVTITLGVKLW